MATKDYEGLFIIKPDLTEEDTTAVVDTLTGFLTGKGATLTEQENWGKKRLAYPINKNRYGTYLLLRFTADSGVIPQFEASFRFNENVLKSQIVYWDGAAGRGLAEAAAAKAAAAESDASSDGD